MFKDIIVPLALGSEKDPARDYAFSIAQAFDAHITGVAYDLEPIAPPTIIGTIPGDFLAEQKANASRQAAEAVARFEAQAAHLGLAHEPLTLPVRLAEAAVAFARMARRYDLVVVPQAMPSGSGVEELTIEAALFQSGRPLLMVPYIQTKPLALDRVAIAWDGGEQAARAIHDAMPLLRKAKQVQVVTISTQRAPTDEMPSADIARHLARHGLNVEAKRLVSGELDVASTLLSHFVDDSIDLVVMGGYGHSRIREFILGGATRGMLASATIPAFMAH